MHLVRATWVQLLFDLIDSSLAVLHFLQFVSECGRLVDLTFSISSSQQSFLCLNSVLCEAPG